MPVQPTPQDDYTERIKRLRIRMGLTQAALAKELGVSFPTINRWENGKTKPSKLAWTQLLELAGENDTFSGRIAEPESPAHMDDHPGMDFTANPAVVRTLAEGERLSFGHLANPAFATEISSIDPLPHQRIAVYDHMLRQTRLRFLLADDAGAGKTIMTGLYIREMLSRRMIKRVLIIPPAGLVGNWQRELQVLFNMKFKVISGSDTKSGNPFAGADGDRCIISVDTLAGSRVFTVLQQPEVESYDLVVFDEAHKLSSDRGSDFRVKKTDRYRLAEALAGVHTGDESWQLAWYAHHLLLLTATPHMGKEYPYYAIWRLLDSAVLSTMEAFDQFPAELRKNHFIRRTKEEMVRLDGAPLYPKRISDTLAYELSQGEIGEQTLYEATTEYLRHVYNKAKLLNQSAARLAMSVFQRRLASSTYALLRSFERRIEKLEQIIEDVQLGKITIEQLLTLQRRIREEDDILDTKTADDESGAEGQEENEIAEERLLKGVIATSLAELLAEKEQVIGLRDLARRVHDGGLESKFEKLREIIANPKFTGEKIIIFTEHRDTLIFLTRRLEGMGYTGQLAQIHGGMHYTERQTHVERFRLPTTEGGARFMLCTDAAAEGINLQFCWIMVNYDIPWNPARLEQRMGRIHRYGQKHDPVIILNLVAPGTREGRVLKTLLDKLEKIRKQLRSDKVFDSIGRIFSDVSIKRYMEMVLDENADVESVARELDGRLSKEQMLALSERERRIYGDGDVVRDLPRLRETMEKETYFRLLPGYVRQFIEKAAPLVSINLEGNLDDHFSMTPARKGAMDPLFPVLEHYAPSQTKRMTLHRPADRDASIWMHPGEVVFEAFRELVRERLDRDALRGSVFVDPTAQRPYLFHLARLTIVRQADPEMTELGQEEVLQYRLVGVRQEEGLEIALCPVEHLLMLRDGRGLPAEGQRLAVHGETKKEQAEAFLVERVARTMAVEMRASMLDALAHREEGIQRGFDHREAELATARAKISRKAREGNKGAILELAKIKNHQREIAMRREKALSMLRREPELIVPGRVDFIAHALVVPSQEDADQEAFDANTEKVAMEMVRVYEEALGATVRFIHTPALAMAASLPDHPGFDIFATYPDGKRRCIEVKGRAGIGDVEVTENEWARACNLRHDYWLYVVYHCATPRPQLVRVQDPFGRLLVKAKGSVMIGSQQILQVSEAQP
ncbi:MAG: DUF3883 domain-containing protein [Magnetococcales bacterium]|nr:DUF3883 domain-containing protein [Magnetococcales bacterium]